jgi:hypothetical protein
MAFGWKPKKMIKGQEFAFAAGANGKEVASLIPVYSALIHSREAGWRGINTVSGD